MNRLLLTLLTVLLFTIGSISATTHFEPPNNNPYNPMTIYFIGVTLDGAHLTVGDEIAIFDGDQIVGATVLKQKVTEKTPEVIAVGQEDNGSIGFQEGDKLSFRVWDRSKDREVTVQDNEIFYYHPKTGEKIDAMTFEPLSAAMVSIHPGMQAQVEADSDALPEEFELEQNFPNPFNPATTISYSCPKGAFVTLQIFDISGRHVKTLAQGWQVAGKHTIQWNGTDERNRRVAAGIYFYKLSSADFSKVKKMIFAK